MLKGTPAMAKGDMMMRIQALHPNPQTPSPKLMFVVAGCGQSQAQGRQLLKCLRPRVAFGPAGFGAKGLLGPYSSEVADSLMLRMLARGLAELCAAKK